MFNRLRSFSAAVMIATVLAIGLASSATLSANDGSIPVSTICRVLQAAENAANTLPAGALKDAILRYLNAIEARFGCQ
ncbi:MAG TPA: hypothetical protein VKD69_13355 [Vicinamibacterales bacterium]|nr:hypothetical protein [Vicinamibacterales bacterium]